MLARSLPLLRGYWLSELRAISSGAAVLLVLIVLTARLARYDKLGWTG
jgi:hypothetical protein